MIDEWIQVEKILLAEFERRFPGQLYYRIYARMVARSPWWAGIDPEIVELALRAADEVDSLNRQ